MYKSRGTVSRPPRYSSLLARSGGVELTLVDGTVVATGNRTGIRAHQIKVDERLFEYSNSDRYFSRKRWFGGDPHFRNDRQIVELPSADPVFRVEGGHYNHRAESVVTFQDSSEYRFPVWGPLKRAVMVCLDDRGQFGCALSKYPATEG